MQQPNEESPCSPQTITSTNPSNNDSGVPIDTAVPPAPSSEPSTEHINTISVPPPPSEVTTTLRRPYAPVPGRAIWTASEVRRLTQLRNQRLNWAQIAIHFVGKSANACRKRYERYRRGVRGRRSISEGGNGRGVALSSVVGGGAVIHSAQAQIQRIIGQLSVIEGSMGRELHKIQSSGSLGGFTAVNGTRNELEDPQEDPEDDLDDDESQSEPEPME